MARLKLTISAFFNRLRRSRGPAFRDQCAALIMRMCSLQLERTETRELAPTPGAFGPITLSGGAITQVTYKVFDPNADRLDPKIKIEPWRAFATVSMTLTIEQDPQFTVQLEDFKIEPNAAHKAPGLALIKHLSNYFPLLPKAYTGAVYAPYEEHA